MDRYYRNLRPGSEDSFNLNDFTASATIARLGEAGLHHKVLERAALERSGLPLNNQLCLPWNQHHLFEEILEYLAWPNVGISTLLHDQNAHGQTPLIKAMALYQMKCNWMSKLDELDRAVADFRKKMGLGDKGLTDQDFIRFYHSPVTNPEYLGVIVACETHLFDWEKKQRLPVVIEIGANYPRYIHSGPAEAFLSVQVDAWGKRTYLKPGGECFDVHLPAIERFIREQAHNINQLASRFKTDAISLEMEYVPPDWLRVFDLEQVALSNKAKLLMSV